MGVSNTRCWWSCSPTPVSGPRFKINAPTRLPGPTAGSGTYALWSRIDDTAEIGIGRHHRLWLEPGWAVYVGSAFGPGGTAARLAHHRRPACRPHWHIDYLRSHTLLEVSWISHDPIHRECLWAMVLGVDLGGAAPSFRFGASDCRCPSHLFWFRERLTLAEFVAALRHRCPAHAPILEQGESARERRNSLHFHA